MRLLIGLIFVGVALAAACMTETWNSLLVWMPGIIGIVCTGSFMYGQTGTIWLEVEHRKDHDIDGAVSRWSEDGQAYVNTGGKTYIMHEPAPRSSKNDWADPQNFNNRRRTKVVKARLNANK